MIAPRGKATAVDFPAAKLRRTARLLLLGLLLIGAVIAWHWRASLDPAELGATIGRYPSAPLVFLAVHIAGSLLFVPRTVMAIAAGLLFGIGWSLAGMCPGPILVNIGEGKIYALAALAGALVGAGAFGAAYPALQRTFRLPPLAVGTGEG